MSNEHYSLKRFGTIGELREIWDEIYFGNPRLAPYQSYEFCETLVRDFRFSRQRLFLSPVFFVLFRGGEARILLPLWRKRARAYYLIPDFLITPYRDLVWRADCAPQEFERALSMTKAALGGATLYLRRINERSATFSFLAQRTAPANPQPCVRIEIGGGYDGWYGGLSKSARQNLRTAENRLLRAGHTASLALDAGWRPTDAEWNEIIQVHRKRYHLRDGESLGPVTNWIRRNHDPIEKMLRFSDGNFLARLYIDGGLAAFFNGLLSGDGRTVSVCRLSIDDDYDFFSPGALLLARAIARLTRETEIQTLDLCYGSQPYKYRMGGIESMDYDFVY